MGLNSEQRNSTGLVLISLTAKGDGAVVARGGRGLRGNVTDIDMIEALAVAKVTIRQEAEQRGEERNGKGRSNTRRKKKRSKTRGRREEEEQHHKREEAGTMGGRGRQKLDSREAKKRGGGGQASNSVGNTRGEEEGGKMRGGGGCDTQGVGTQHTYT